MADTPTLAEEHGNVVNCGGEELRIVPKVIVQARQWEIRACGSKTTMSFVAATIWNARDDFRESRRLIQIAYQ